MANARVPVTLLDGVTGTGAGSTTDLGESFGTFSLVCWTTGSSGSGYAYLQGSHDGSHWFDLIAISVGPSSVATQRANDVVHARYVRGNVTSFSGLSTLTLTVVPA